jgi:hypothetical protein
MIVPFDFSFCPLHSSLIIAILSLFFFSYKIFVNRLVISGKSIWIFFLPIALFFYTLFGQFWSTDTDLTIVKKVAYIFCLSLPLGFLYCYASDKRSTISTDEKIEKFLKIFQFVSIFLSLFVLLSFFFQNIRSVIDLYLPAQGNILDSSHFAYSYRVRGLLPSTGAFASVFFSIGAIISFFFLRYSNNLLNFIFNIVAIITQSLAILLNGNSGFFIVIMYLCYAFFIFLSTLALKLKAKKKSCFMLFAIILIILMLLPLIYNFKDSLNRLTNEFSLLLEGDFANSTFGTLADMFFWQGSEFEKIFGNVSSYSVNNIPSDIGYVRNLHALGLLAFFVYYFFWILLFIFIFFAVNSKKLRQFVVFLFILFFSVEVKEPFFNYLSYSVFLVTLYMLACVKFKVRRTIL